MNTGLEIRNVMSQRTVEEAATGELGGIRPSKPAVPPITCAPGLAFGFGII